ncbi:hypothetical protein niasHT_007759 [Heterodera trifolii]|uniref:Eyes absent homolog n=1 Tax=Heterodera trifolii TaxID=157864 RepID=A0ABD2LKQ6_9BILA
MTRGEKREKVGNNGKGEASPGGVRGTREAKSRHATAHPPLLLLLPKVHPSIVGPHQNAITNQVTATKFEPGTKFPSVSVVHPSMLSSLGHSSSSSASSSATVSSSSFPQNTSPYYCWPVGAAEWSLAAAAMSRSAVLCADSSSQIGALCAPSQTYYGQMAAAAAVSASSSVPGAGTAWYSPNNCEYYDGLQRAAGHTLNGYLGTYGGGNAYSSPANGYYGASFPAASHYAAAALSSTFDTKKAELSYLPMAAAYCGGTQPQQQQYSNLTGAGFITQPTSSELDTSALIGETTPNQRNGARNGSTANYMQQYSSPIPSVERKATAFAENTVRSNGAHQTKKSAKSQHKTASKRSKKKKAQVNASGGTRVSPTEPNNTALVFVWELEDLCTVRAQNAACRNEWESQMSSMLNQLLQYGFQLESPEEFEQTNVEDAASDEALQNAQNYAAANGAGPMPRELGLSNGAGGEEVKRTENGAQLSPQRHQQLKQEMLPDGPTPMQANCSNSPAASTARPVLSNINSNEGLRKLAAKYRLIRDTYELYGGHRMEVWLQQFGILPAMFRRLESYEQLPFSTIELFRQCLRVVSERSRHIPNRCANVVWSSTGTVGVAGALGQLMLCRMSEFVPAENVYCTARMGREAVMERLSNHFQKKHITMISSKEETWLFAKKEGIPCWSLRSDQCIVKFRHALDILLGHFGGTTPTCADILMQRTMPKGRFAGDGEDEEMERKSGGGTMALGGGGAGRTGNGAGAFLTVRG